MKKVIYIILCAIALSACEKGFNIERQMKDGMTYLKFVPSNEDDTTFFHVQATTALKDWLNPAKTSGETVSVTVNGIPVALTKDLKKSADDRSQIYWTKHVFKPGDEVVVETSVPGLEPASATAIVPGEGPEYKWKARLEANPDSYWKQLCIDLEYVNKPGFTGHYGVAVRYERTTVREPFFIFRDNPDVIEWGEPETWEETGDEYPSSAFDLALTSLGQEPLVLNPGSLNRDYRWNQHREEEYFDPGYYSWGPVSNVVSWVDIPEKEARTSRQQIRVNYNGTYGNYIDSVPEGYWDWEWAGDVFTGFRSSTTCRYKLVFYNYDENSYNYLKARENEENDLALFGLAPASFTFTNVKNGVGVCGAYMVKETDWFTVDE